MVLALVLDVVEVVEVGALELVVADGEHLVEREAGVGALLVVARQRHEVVGGERVRVGGRGGQQAPHQAAELVERHADRLEAAVEVELGALRLERRLDAHHDRVDVRLRKLRATARPASATGDQRPSRDSDDDKFLQQTGSRRSHSSCPRL